MFPSPAGLEANTAHAGACVVGADRRWLAVLVVALGTLYAASWSEQWYLSPDSAMYLLLGDSLASGEGYRLGGVPHAKYPPGFPLLLAGMQLAGLGSVPWLNAVMLGLGLAVLALSYRLLAGKGPGWLVMTTIACLGVNFELYRASRMLLSDVPFILMALAGVYCLQRGSNGQRGWLATGTVLLVACTWVRLVGIALAVGAAVAIAIKNWNGNTRRRTLICAAILVVGSLSTAAYWGWRASHLAASHTGKSYAAEMSELTGREASGWLYDPVLNLYGTGEEISRLLIAQTLPCWLAWLLFGVPIAIGCFRSVRQGDLLWAFVVLAYVSGIVVVRTPIVRYLMPVAPFLMWYFFSGLEQLCEWGTARRAAIVTMGVAAAVVGANLPKDLWLAYGAHWSNFASFRADWPPLVEAAAMLKKAAQPGDRFLAPTGEAEILAYLSGVPFMEVGRVLAKNPPAGEQMSSMLADEGITLVVFDPSTDKIEKPFFKNLTSHVQRSSDFRCIATKEYTSIYRRELRQAAKPTADRGIDITARRKSTSGT